MSGVTLAVLLAVAFGGLLVWLLRPRESSAESGHPPIDRAMESALPKHYQYFPQIRQALSAVDSRYLRDVAPPRIAKQVFRERRGVALHFLRGLREDYSGLERLARMVASLSPAVSREQEIERLLLGLRFRLLYALVWLRLSVGTVPVEQIGQMTELVGRFALRMEQAMAGITALSANHVSSGLKA